MIIQVSRATVDAGIRETCNNLPAQHGSHQSHTMRTRPDSVDSGRAETMRSADVVERAAVELLHERSPRPHCGGGGGGIGPVYHGDRETLRRAPGGGLVAGGAGRAGTSGAARWREAFPNDSPLAASPATRST